MISSLYCQCARMMLEGVRERAIHSALLSGKCTRFHLNSKKAQGAESIGRAGQSIYQSG